MLKKKKKLQYPQGVLAPVTESSQDLICKDP